MPTVMVVDDSLFMRRWISRVLNDSGYETILAENGEQAAETYQQTRPDAVLMDIAMPRKDGIQALSEIQTLDASARVIMLTAIDQELAVKRAIQLGARDFLIKPIPPKRLLTALHRALSRDLPRVSNRTHSRRQAVSKRLS